MNIEKTVIRVIAAQAMVEEPAVNGKTSLVEDLRFDSLDMIETVILIEEEFDIEIDDQAIESMNTVGQIVEYVENLMKEEA